MISLKLLKELGVTQAALKAAFTAEQPSEKVQAFKERASSRIQEGINSAFSSYQLWFAIDRCLDTAMFQTSRTLMQGLLENKVDSKDVLSMVKSFGFDRWISTSCGCGQSCTNVDGCLNKKTTIDFPAFFEVTFPIALAMKTVRAARIYNDRNLYPQFKYEPLVSTPEHRLKCEIVTHRVQVQSQQMGYKPVLKQVINQMLSYSTCLLFPREAWWYDQQPTRETTGNKKPKRKKRTVKEGIRYEHPHPSRMYYDLSHPLYTVNSDTGCQFGGYWGLVRYGEVMDNPDYWNTEDITFGKESLRITESNKLFFSTVMPCSMKFPDFKATEDGIAGPIDRQERLQRYSTDHRDCAVLLTNHFERLNPLRDLGLKNKQGEGYDGDVWFRFVLCSDDTVVYAEPLAYAPMLGCFYDPDANKAHVTSMVQECLPAQDMVGNLLTQAILQAKNNLRNINFVNTDVIDQPVLDQLANLGEKSLRAPQYVPFSAHEANITDNDRREAIIPVQLQRMSISECLTLINTIWDILARGLVMSSHELGQSDTHEVTAQEVLTRAGSTSTRLAYTASSVDDFINAWQKQLHDAGLEYWDDEVFAEVALQSDTDEKDLENLGFKVETRNTSERKVGVRGDKSKLELDMFTMRRDAPDRVNSVAMATAMTNFFQAFINNPMALQIIGIDQFVELVNKILEAFQFRKDWRLTAKADPFKEQKEMAEKQAAQEQQMAAQASQQGIIEQLKAIIPQIQQQIIGEVGVQLKPVLEQAAQVDLQQTQQIASLEDAMGKMIEVLQLNGQLPPPQPQPQPMMAQPMGMPV